MVRHVKIGPFLFDVFYEEGYIGEEGNTGTCCVGANELRVSKELSKTREHSILIHEIIEAYNSLYDMKLPHSKINMLETIIYDFIVSNQDLVSEITEEHNAVHGY